MPAENLSPTPLAKAKPSPIGIYIVAVAAALISTIFDELNNGDSSAMKKLGWTIFRIISVEEDPRYSNICALIFFGLVSVILVYVYAPRERKEAFVLGLSVLGFAGVATAPRPPPKGIPAISTGASVSALPQAVTLSQHGQSASLRRPFAGFELISSAYAQPSPIPEGPAAVVWLFLDGPSQLRTPETRLFVIEKKTKATVVNTLTNSAFVLSLPPGSYQIEVSHVGYRSTFFNADFVAGTQVFQIPVEPVNFDLQNFFGPKKAKPKAKPDWAEKFDAATKTCSENPLKKSLAKKELDGIDSRWTKNLAPEAKGLLCI